MDLGAAIAKLPPGTDVYAFLEQQIDQFIFPDLDIAFWTQAYVVVGVLATFITVFVTGYVWKAKAGRLQWITHDGAATRLHHMNLIPILYIANALSLIGFTFSIRRDLLAKHWTASSGRFWYLAWLPLVLSFTVISHSAIASSPPIRNSLSRVGRPWSLVYLNGGLFLVLALVSGAICVPAVALGKIYVRLQIAYDTCTALVQDARATNNTQILAGLQAPVLDMMQANKDTQNSVRLGGIIYSVNSIVALIAGGAMAYVLSSVVAKRIDRLERKSTSSWSASVAMDATPTIVIPTLSANDFPPSTDYPDVELASRTTFKPRPDQPFSGLVRTPSLPERFQTVLDQEDVTSQEKAEQLRAVLRHDHHAMLVYVLCVVIYLAATLFMSANGERTFDMAWLIQFNYIYCSWAFLIPGCLASSNFLRDALHSPRAPASASNKKAPPAQPFIGVSQTFSIAEDSGDISQEEEKKFRF